MCETAGRVDTHLSKCFNERIINHSSGVEDGQHLEDVLMYWKDVLNPISFERYPASSI